MAKYWIRGEAHYPTGWGYFQVTISDDSQPIGMMDPGALAAWIGATWPTLKGLTLRNVSAEKIVGGLSAGELAATMRHYTTKH